MANTKKTVKIQRSSDREDPNFFVAVNGVNYLIPKGKSVEVPDYVAAEIERSQQAKEAFFDTSDALVKRAAAPVGQ